jgi:hypothetical protein
MYLLPVLGFLSCNSAKQEQPPANSTTTGTREDTRDTVENTDTSAGLKERIKDYYFPVEAFSSNKVYHYRVTGTERGDIYLVLHAHSENGQTFYTTEEYLTIFPGPLQRMETLTESLGDQGSDITEYIEIQYFGGSSEQVKTLLKGTRTFNWEMAPDDMLKWSFTSPSAEFEGAKVINNRERIYTGEKGTFQFKKQEYPTINFQEKYESRVMNENGKHVSGFVFNVDAYYAKGLGLVRKEGKSTIGEFIHELVEVLSQQEWKKRKTIEGAID